MQHAAHKYLDSLGIPFEALSFPASIQKGAASVALVLGRNFTCHQVVKSLVFETSTGELILVLLGGDQSVVSGLLKKAVSDRNIRMAPPDRIRELSGYEIGSIPPFSWQPPGFRTYIDDSLLRESLLAVGAGTWGQEIILTPSNLVRASRAIPAKLT